jgi:HlyD family secretion protein
MLDLEGAVIKSPVDGVVTAMEIQVGEQAGTAPVISVAEAVSSRVRFWVEELDVANVSLGNPVKILFEAYPNLTFTGQVTRIDPTLATVDGAAAVQVWASIDPMQHPANLLYGMNAEVEVIAGEARNALLAPVQALRELAPGSYAVFVVLPNGELEMRPVEVGLRDFVNVEILFGLNLGEEVSTGDAATQ